MKNATRMVLALALLALLALLPMLPQLVLAQGTPLPEPQIESAVGQVAPDFSLVDQEKQPFHLAAHHGEKVLLIFYRGYWCPYCTMQLRDFARHAPEFRKANTQIVAISVDDPERALEVWKTVVSRQFPVLSDSGAQVIRKYGLLQDLGADGEMAVRTTLLVDEKGLERWRRVSRTVEDIPKATVILKRIETQP